MLNREQLEQKVIDIVQETLALETPPKLDDSFREDLNADSIDIVTLLVSLEDELDTPFDQNALQDKDTLLSVVDFLDDLLLKREPV